MSDERAKEIAVALGRRQRAVILALSEEWGVSGDYSTAKRMWYGVGKPASDGTPTLLIDHKHQTDDCWRLRPLGLAVRRILEEGGDAEQ